jgi:hypothetical protein
MYIKCCECIFLQNLLSISVDNLGLVVSPVFGYLFGCGFKSAVSSRNFMVPGDTIVYEEGIGDDVACSNTLVNFYLTPWHNVT